MGESLIPIAEIATFIIDLQRELRGVKNDIRVIQKEFDLGASEEPQDVGGQIPATAADYKTPVTVVTTVIDDTCIMVKRQIPDAAGTGWTDDPELTSELEVTLPPGITPPLVGRVIQPVYTGLYQINTLGTTISVPRYGLFGAGGGTTKNYLVIEEFDDYLRCRTKLGTVVGADDVFVAKPFRLRRTPFEGTTVKSITYTYSPLSGGGNGTRLAEFSATEQEVQLILPSYVSSFDEILAVTVDGGSQVTAGSTPVLLEDLNNAGRQFMRIAEAP